MKTILQVAICLVCIATLAFGASIDGKWYSERAVQNNTIKQTFDLKSDGGKLMGKVTIEFGDMEPRTSEVQDGKVDGDKFSFSVTMEGPNGQVKQMFEGKVDGDALKGTATREGGQPRPFEAKKK